MILLHAETQDTISLNYVDGLNVLAWSTHNGYEYMESSMNSVTNMNVTQASKICQTVGAKLASITSYDEHQFLG